MITTIFEKQIKHRIVMSQFIVYTYQFSPIKNSQTLFEESIDYDKIMNEKQTIFSNILSSEIKYQKGKRIYQHQILRQQDGITILKLANNKQTRLEQDFKTNIIKYGPSCNIIIDNRKDIQHILVENISTSFTDTKTVVSILKDTFNAYLKQHHLHIEIDKEFQQSEFWNIVDAHPLEITLVRFYFKYPNLPRALASVNELLASTSKATNSKETILQIKSNDSEQLELSQDNNELNSLVKASADSGSIITLKIKGYNKHIHTGRTSKTVEIDSIELAAEEDIFNQAIDKVVSTLNSLK